MDEMSDKRLDEALDALARDVAAGTPRPGPDLMARVLADAGAVAASRGGAARPAPRQKADRPGLGARIGEVLFGWTTGAVAAMALALAVGIGIGMQADVGQMPMLAADDDATMIFAEAGGPDDIF